MFIAPYNYDGKSRTKIIDAFSRNLRSKAAMDVFGVRPINNQIFGTKLSVDSLQFQSFTPLNLSILYLSTP
jgi:hypothetical protein